MNTNTAIALATALQVDLPEGLSKIAKKDPAAAWAAVEGMATVNRTRYRYAERAARAAGNTVSADALRTIADAFDDLVTAAIGSAADAA